MKTITDDRAEIQVTDRRRIEGDRLAFYGEAPDQAYWDRRLETNLCLADYCAAQKGKLSNFEKEFRRLLTKEDRILDAGCGIGDKVLALRVLGYNCEGIDWAQNTIKTVKKLFPDLPVKSGDATHIDVPDGFYSAYISLGVMEHLQTGPDPFIKEAFRVLSFDGIAFVTVPYYHTIRKIKAKLGFYQQPVNDDIFYQYAFTTKEFSSYLEKYGFKVEQIAGVSAGIGLAKELPILSTLVRLRLIGGLVWRASELIPFTERYFGHMFLIIARKKSSIKPVQSGN
jgi:SAM-dependent methyltransferase